MHNTTKINKINQEEVKMRKLIVEAPELKEGQTDSSGGIRENGKMSVQYKNPVPYVEPRLPPATPQRIYTRKDMIKNQAKDLAIDIGMDLLFMLWHEYGKPFIKAKLHQLSQEAIIHLDTQTKASQLLAQQDASSSSIIDEDYIDITETDDLEENNKIIRFPIRHVS